MIKRTLKAIFLILCLGLFMPGCQETPEQVKENMNQYGDNSQLKESEITYCTVPELRGAKMPEDIGDTALQFPDSVDFSHVEEVGVLHLSRVTNFLKKENVKKYAELFGLSSDQLHRAEGSDTLEYDNGKDKYMNISENGGMAQGFGFSYALKENKVENKYNLDEEDVSGVRVQLADGEVGLGQFCKDTEDWLEKNMPIKGMHYKVSDAWIRKENRKAKDDPVRILSLCAEYDYKGMRLNNHTMSLGGENEDDRTKNIVTCSSVILDYETKGLPCYLSQSMAFTFDSAEPVEKIVDLPSSVRIVKEKMSGFGALQITKILPLYVLYEEEEAGTAQTGIEARPVFAFLIEEESEDPSNGVIKVNNARKFIFVDMVNGELTESLESGK